MAYGKSLLLKAIQPTKYFTPNPSRAVRKSLSGDQIVKYPDGTQYVWHNGGRRKLYVS